MQQKLEWFVEPAGGIPELHRSDRVCLLWLGIAKASRCGNERQQLSSRRKLAVGMWWEKNLIPLINNTLWVELAYQLGRPCCKATTFGQRILMDTCSLRCSSPDTNYYPTKNFPVMKSSNHCHLLLQVFQVWNDRLHSTASRRRHVGGEASLRRDERRARRRSRLFHPIWGEWRRPARAPVQ